MVRQKAAVPRLLNLEGLHSKYFKVGFLRDAGAVVAYMLGVNKTVVDTQVRSDVTRFRYGDEQHLEEALKRIFRYGQVLKRFSDVVSFVLDQDERNLSFVLTYAIIHSY